MVEAKQNQTRFTRWIKWLAKWLIRLVMVYVIIVLVGLIPINNDFIPAEDGIQIYVVSNEVHADIIVPIQTETIDWSEEFNGATFAGDVSGMTHVAIGWGDKGFFLETETWDDFKLSVAANALLLPSESCVHVSFTNPEYHRDAATVSVSQAQYQSLVEFINGRIFRSQRAISFAQHLQLLGWARLKNLWCACSLAFADAQDSNALY